MRRHRPARSLAGVRGRSARGPRLQARARARLRMSSRRCPSACPRRHDAVRDAPPPLGARPRPAAAGTPSLGAAAAFRRGDYAASAMSATVWLVIPTYNEAENLAQSSRRRRRARARSAGRPPDPDRGRQLARTAPARSRTRWPPSTTGSRCCTARARAASGQAYLAGFARALAGGAQLVIEMDADFSHDPRTSPSCSTAAEHADLVLGSRYVPGGGVARLGPAAAAGQPRRRHLCAARSSA